MQNFADLVADNPHAIEQLFISDLHLNATEPATNLLGQAFLDFLDTLVVLPNLKQFFILGDWFETWLGDDVADTAPMQNYLTPMIERLRQLNQNGCQIYIMHGNRDFLIGQKFCDKFGGRLIDEPFYLTLNGKKIRLEHGDALCTDDKAYQHFRNIIQHPITKRVLLALPIKKRQQIAQDLRQKSKNDNAKKSMQIMDVNELAVSKALDHADILIHGHTHRPAVHQEGDKTRLVLGDWRIVEKSISAVIGIVMNETIQLVMLTP